MNRKNPIKVPSDSNENVIKEEEYPSQDEDDDYSLLKKKDDDNTPPDLNGSSDVTTQGDTLSGGNVSPLKKHPIGIQKKTMGD
jgi:hypothetical protein